MHSQRQSHSGRSWVAGAAVLVLILPSASPVFAHGLALPFAFWGNFSAPAAHCQRMLGDAATRCALETLQIRNSCLLSLLNGGPCESPDFLTFLLQGDRFDVIDRIDSECTTPQTQALGFLIKFEAETDLNVFCQAVDVAMVSAIYGPIQRGDIIRLPTPTEQRCIGAIAQVATRLLPFAFRTRRLALDRIANRQVDPNEKQKQLDDSAAKISRLQAHLEATVALDCPDADFTSVYHRDVHTVLTAIAQRADCLSAAVYVQNGIVCPFSVCGNGVQEAGEQCDDGNLIDGDGCSSSCLVEVAPPR